MDCDIVLKVKKDNEKISFMLPKNEYKVIEIFNLISLCDNKYNGYCRVKISPPYKKRTKKENNGLHGWVKQIADYIGDDMDSVLRACKIKAISRGYPVKKDINGNVIINPVTDQPIPISSALTNTKECSILIDVIQQVASELGIVLDNRE